MKILYKGFLYESEAPNKVTLNVLYPEGIPSNELLNEWVSPSDMNIPFTIKELPVSELKKLTNNGELVSKLYRYADEEQKEIVKYYMKLKGELTREPIVVSEYQLLDGFHRTIAAIKTNTPLKAIDISEDIDENIV